MLSLDWRISPVNRDECRLCLVRGRPFGAIADPGTQRRLQIGLDYTPLPQRVGPDLAGLVPDDPFRTAFLRIKSERGLYHESTNGVTFLSQTLFRAGIALPGEVPIGTYEIDIKLFADGRLLTRSQTAFEVVKVGFEQVVAEASRRNGVVYGLTTTAMALLIGWFASMVFRRD